ncbi:MAG TPA: DUF6492 family protein [Myxococcota bacterium]|jgi:hypothetical protein
MDIVIPLLASDLDRYLRLQRPTFERHYADLRTSWVIARPQDRPEVERATAGLAGVRVLDERELIPELALARALRRDHRRDWYVQQLIKLAAVSAVDTEFALVLDADVLAVRSVSDSDLVVDGRALRVPEPLATHPQWVAQAAEALGLEPLDYSASVTPSVLAREAVRLLARYAEECVRPRHWRMRAASLVPGIRGRLSSWRGRLLAALPWTEYQLYDTFLVRGGHFDRFHRYSIDPVLYENSVWRASHFEDWSPIPRGDTPIHFFSVVQGFAGIPVEVVREKLEAGGLLPRSR